MHIRVNYPACTAQAHSLLPSCSLVNMASLVASYVTVFLLFSEFCFFSMAREYKAGDLIFAKMKGYPHWPARVRRHTADGGVHAFLGQECKRVTCTITHLSHESLCLVLD